MKARFVYRSNMQTVHPGSQRFTADAARKDLAFCQPCALAALPKHFVGCSHAAAAGGRKGNDGFSGQVIAFQKGIDDVGRDIPPGREVRKNRPR